MTVENRPQALTQALAIALVDPLGDKRLTNYTDQRVGQYKKCDPGFGIIYDRTLEEASFTQEEKDSLNLYLAATAYTLVSYAFPPSSSLEQDVTLQKEVEATRIHLHHLTFGRDQTEEEALNHTWKLLYPEGSHISPPKPKDKSEMPKENEEYPEKLALLKGKLREIVGEIKRRMKEEGFVPGIRDIQEYYGVALAYSHEIGLADPPLFNLTLGNINWIGDGWEEQFLDIPERLGLTGIKSQRIAQKVREYEELMKRAGINIYEYQDPPLGWKALIERHRQYLNHFGIFGYQSSDTDSQSLERFDYHPQGSFIATGGSDGMRKAFLIARKTIINKSLMCPKVLFPTPGFTMIADEARNLRIEPVELVTSSSDDFHPTADKIIGMLKKDPAIRILDLTPFTNPGTTIGLPDQYHKIFRALEQYKKETGITVYVVLDLAYLGMGDLKRNMELAQVLNTYKHRFDVMPTSTKILQEPALRCCGVFTPDEDLAANIVEGLRGDTITLPFAMQVQAMATFDFVDMDDIRAGMEVFVYRQQRMQEVLGVRPDIFQRIMADSTLYTCNMLKDCVDPIDLMLAGFFFTPDYSFYLNGTIPEERFVRAALGMIPMTDRNVARMKRALKETDFSISP